MTPRPYAVGCPLWTAMLASLLMLACTERPTGDEASSSSAPESSSTGPSTSASPTTSTSGSVSASESSGSTDGATTPTTGATTAPSTGTDSGSSESSGASSSTGGAVGLVLDPSTLVMFELPIGSIRYAVGGHDPEHDTCVSIIFYHPGMEEHCDDFEVGEGSKFPYVVITPGGSPPCMDWDYSGNVTVDAAAGCMQVTSENPLAITIDMNLGVSGDILSGTIAVSNK